MSPFDADAEDAALAPPELVVGGRTFRGRVLSRDELRPHAATFGNKDASPEAKEGAALALLRAVYGHPWWMFWRPNVVKRVTRMAPATLESFWEHFFTSLARMVTPPTPKKMSGPSLLPSTPEPTSGSPRAGSAGV